MITYDNFVDLHIGRLFITAHYPGTAMSDEDGCPRHVLVKVAADKAICLVCRGGKMDEVITPDLPVIELMFSE